MTRKKVGLYTSYCQKLLSGRLKLRMGAFVLAGIAVVLAIASKHLQPSVLPSIAALIVLVVLSHFQENITNEGE
jgi:hypothetical protein